MNVTQLDADTDFLCGSTSATYQITDKRRNQNIAYHDVARIIWENADGWQYVDSNASGLPIAVSNLVHNQEDYELPTTCQRVQRVTVLDSNGNERQLIQKDIHDTGVLLDAQELSPGFPMYYDLLGRSIILYPTPASGSVTLASGLQVYIDPDVTDLAVSATTTIPGFATPFHRILSYAASIDFVQDENTRAFYVRQKDRLEKAMAKFYSKRNVERPAKIKPKSKRFWRQYL